MTKVQNLRSKLAAVKNEARKLLNENRVKEAKEKTEEAKRISNELEEAIKEEEREKEILLNSYKNGDKRKENNTIANAINKNESFFNRLFNNINLEEEDKEIGIGKYLRGALTGEWKGAENERKQFVALNTSSGKTLIPKVLSAQIIDLARPQTVLSDIPIIPMESNNLTIAKIASDPKIAFKEESQPVEGSEMTFESIELKSKTAYGFMKISLELLESARNIDEVISQALSKAVAEMIDSNGLYGDGVLQPKGLLTYDTINSIGSESIDKTKYISLVKGVGEITNANGIPTTIAYNSKIDTELNMLTDTTGQPLNPPKVISDLTHKRSNNIKDNQAVVYDNNSIVMGVQNKITIDTSEAAGFADGTVWIRVYAMLDFAILNPKNITKISYTS
ncbi:phage major capsid protein [Clostridium perfringens]|uniref:phage major capsid protein n=1 Tax=Clostridium perfringens TaxID=1502 RepID=UPI002468F34C|nr:phage major capsid protein [Clostridium perfringens]MDH5085198.1 Phage capsid family protein [Clostridium perfringens]